MSTRRRAVGTCLLLASLALLGGCPRPASERAQDRTATATPAADAAAADTAGATRTTTPTTAQAAPARGKLDALKVRTGGPLPPRMVPEPVALDRHCRTDADCAIKDIGSCCGAFPACVNVDSPTDPAAVQAECARQGQSAQCATATVEGCRCVRGSCVALAPALDPPVDPAPQAPVDR